MLLLIGEVIDELLVSSGFNNSLSLQETLLLLLQPKNMNPQPPQNSPQNGHVAEVVHQNGHVETLDQEEVVHQNGHAQEVPPLHNGGAWTPQEIQ
jgi:hypothetical protein